LDKDKEHTNPAAQNAAQNGSTKKDATELSFVCFDFGTALDSRS
jgi:hypothetical protein